MTLNPYFYVVKATRITQEHKRIVQYAAYWDVDMAEGISNVEVWEVGREIPSLEDAKQIRELVLKSYQENPQYENDIMHEIVIERITSSR